jgi:uncharacterized protein (TIGR00369 family)
MQRVGDMSPMTPDAVAVVKRLFAEMIPHNLALGLRLVEVGERSLVAELSYRDDLVGNPETGFLHGGAITSLIDATCGTTVPLRLGRAIRVATLDLRIDYLKPATPGQSVFCRAECYKATHNVAFVRATADCGYPDDPIATAAGTFILFRKTPQAGESE